MADPVTSRVASMFDALAPQYDDVGVEFFGPIADGLVRLMAPVAGERWWDVGCGRGAVVSRVAPLLGPTGSVLASDVSPAMLALAAEVDHGPGSAPVEYVVDDAQDPSAALGPVDAMSACLVLFFLPRPEEAVAAWRERIAPGGRLGLATFGPQDERWLRIDALFTPYLPPALLDARTSGTRGPFASAAAMEDLLTSVGFVETVTVEENLVVRFPEPDSWHDFTWSTGQRAGWLAVPEEDRAGVRAQAEAILAETTAPDGSVTLSQIVRYTLARVPDAD